MKCDLAGSQGIFLTAVAGDIPQGSCRWRYDTTRVSVSRSALQGSIDVLSAIKLGDANPNCLFATQRAPCIRLHRFPQGP